MIYGTVERWELETIDRNGDQQQHSFWNWDDATEAFRKEKQREDILRATVYAVQQRSGWKITTWNFTR